MSCPDITLQLSNGRIAVQRARLVAYPWVAGSNVTSNTVVSNAGAARDLFLNRNQPKTDRKMRLPRDKTPRNDEAEGASLP